MKFILTFRSCLCLFLFNFVLPFPLTTDHHKDYIPATDLKDIPEVQEAINRLDEKGLSPLMIAARIGNVEVVKNLIDGGANIDQECPLDGNTPLMIACSSGNLFVAMELIKRGANLKKKNNKLV